MNLDQYFLKWNNFHKNISTSFRELRKEIDFSDVTLVCGDNQQIDAHRVILATASPFFQSILQKSKHSHPMIYLRGVNAIDMKSVVDFIYNGETSVNVDELENFLALAGDLQLRGISDSISKNTDEPKNKFMKKESDQITENYETLSTTYLGDIGLKMDISEKDQFETPIILIEKPLDERILNHNPIRSNSTPETLDIDINGMMEKIQGSKQWECNVCGKISKDKYIMTRHVEYKHVEAITHLCPQCDAIFRTRQGLKVHTNKLHTKEEDIIKSS